MVDKEHEKELERNSDKKSIKSEESDDDPLLEK